VIIADRGFGGAGPLPRALLNVGTSMHSNTDLKYLSYFT
jgi:hypothetical protein